MKNYKSKYTTKALSVYGVPNLNIIYKLKKYINSNTKILIPNCQDGIYVMPLLKYCNSITCFEENKILLNGGTIDNFDSLGLKNRLKYSNYNEKVKIYNNNFYNTNIQKKYDFVFAIRTLQLEENNSHTIESKFKSLMNSVRDGGYLYLNYYIGKDEEVNSNQIINSREINKYIDFSKWSIIYFRENSERPTMHEKHPYNARQHEHKLGSMLLKKTPNIYNKRVINRGYKTGSVYGEANQQVYDYITFMKKIGKNNGKVLIVDAKDGQNVLPFAKNNFNIVCYEDDSVFLNGGQLNNKSITGLKKRINDYSVSKNVIVKDKNYYDIKEIKKFDFVYVYNSLSLEKNSDISIKKKVRKLMSNVSEGGYLYIYYELKKDNDFNESNRYLNLGEMQSYLDLQDWKIEYICERVKTDYGICNSENDILTGYVLAKKKRNRRKYKVNYKIEINNNITYESI